MNNSLPNIKKEGIIEKIKNAFGQIFIKMKKQTVQSINQMNAQGNNIVELGKTDILFDLQKQIANEKIASNDEVLLELQKKIKNGEMQIDELTDKELDELIELYKMQIAKKKLKLAN